MNISALRHRITIEKRVTDGMGDGAGNYTPNWITLATVWADVRPANGQEITLAEKKTQQISHIIKIRYRSDIKKDLHRIKFKGRIFVIEYITNKDERNIELTLQCRE